MAIILKLEQPLANYKGSPQIQDGYVRIANELLDAIITFNFTARQLKVILMVIRTTYGYNKKKDALSGWQIAKTTNLSQQNVSLTLRELIAMKVIIKHETGRQSHGFFVNEISLNKYYSEWLTINKTDSKQNNHQQNNHGQNNDATINEMVTQPSTKQCTHKDIPKDIKYIYAKNKKPTKKTLIPEDFSISENLMKWASEKNHNNLAKHLEYFVNVAMAKGYQYVDWDRAFMNAITANWAKLENKPVNKDLEGIL